MVSGTCVVKKRACAIKIEEVRGNMKKVMISQPMRGLTEEVIRANREAVVKELETKGYEVVDTIHPDYPTHLAERQNNIPIFYLAKSIEFMSNVDTVFFMKGYEDTRGCKIEHSIATAYGLEIIEEV